SSFPSINHKEMTMSIPNTVVEFDPRRQPAPTRIERPTESLPKYGPPTERTEPKRPEMPPREPAEIVFKEAMQAREAAGQQLDAAQKQARNVAAAQKKIAEVEAALQAARLAAFKAQTPAAENEVDKAE